MFRYDDEIKATWSCIKILSVQKDTDFDDVAPLHNFMETRKLRFALLILANDNTRRYESQIQFLEDCDINEHATLLPFENLIDSFRNLHRSQEDYFVIDRFGRHSRLLQKSLQLEDGLHFILVDFEEKRVVCKSAGRYLAYDNGCINFPWEDFGRTAFQNSLHVTTLNDMSRFEHIPRTCFLIGERSRIMNMTIPIIDHMRNIMTVVLFQ